MKKITKILVLMLALVMLTTALAACGGNKTPTPTPDTSETQPDANGGENPGEDLYDKNGYLKDDLPETYDWDKNFTIYSWSNQQNWEWLEAGNEPEPGDFSTAVSEAVLKRQKAVEERMNITFKFRFESGEWGDRIKFIETLAASVTNNYRAFDLVGQYTPSAGIGAVQHLYTDLNKVSYLDLSKPWWPTSISETATIGDKLYFVTGDITPLLIRNVHCMFVNTDMYNSLGLSSKVDGRNIYQVVRDKDWTYETMEELAIGTVETGNFGLTFENAVTADAFFYGAGFTLLENQNGVLSLSTGLTNQTLSDFFDKLKDLYTGEYADVKIDKLYNAKDNLFGAKKSLFFAGMVAASESFTTKGVSFSILPMPLLEKGQEYKTVASFWMTVYSVPVDAADKEMSGMVLEALGSQAYRQLSGEIYYNIFQYRYNAAGEEDSAAMFDIVSKSVVFDSARFFADNLGMYASFRNAVTSKTDATGTWSSVYDGNATQNWEPKIETLYGAIG